MQHDELFKCRSLNLGSDQDVDAACAALLAIDGVRALANPPDHELLFTYRLPQHTLAGLMQALKQQGFVLDDNVVQRTRLSIAAYSEEVQLHNIAEPAIATKSREVFSTIYQHHKHGDSDDTPEELRQYR